MLSQPTKEQLERTIVLAIRTTADWYGVTSSELGLPSELKCGASHKAGEAGTTRLVANLKCSSRDKVTVL